MCRQSLTLGAQSSISSVTITSTSAEGEENRQMWRFQVQMELLMELESALSFPRFLWSRTSVQGSPFTGSHPQDIWLLLNEPPVLSKGRRPTANSTSHAMEEASSSITNETNRHAYTHLFTQRDTQKHDEVSLANCTTHLITKSTIWLLSEHITRQSGSFSFFLYLQKNLRSNFSLKICVLCFCPGIICLKNKTQQVLNFEIQKLLKI